MNFADYPSFRAYVLQLIDGDDISQSDLSIQVVDNLIGAGEQRIYNGQGEDELPIRCSVMDVALTGTTSGNYIPLPADFLELKGPLYVNAFPVSKYMAWEELQNRIQLNVNQAIYRSGAATFYSYEGENIVFFPAQADGTSVTGRYYKRFPDISTGTNAFFDRYPNLFAYAALAESAPFVGETQRLPVWEARYRGLAEGVRVAERRRITGGGKLQTMVGG